jgi:hypothetical protein
MNGKPYEWTEARRAEVVAWLAEHKTTPELRRYQNINQAQQANAFGALKEGAALDLQIMYDCYSNAIMRKEFPEL